MPDDDSRSASALDRRKIALARNLLVDPRPPQRLWPVVAAAAFAAFSALALAATTIMAPPVNSEPVAIRHK
jgi:hypothetical protein